MADDKQYYVKVSFEWGVDNEDGTYAPKNTGDIFWGSMAYENSVGLQNYAIIPALNDGMTKAGELGLMASGMIPFTEGIDLSDTGSSTPSKGKGNTK